MKRIADWLDIHDREIGLLLWTMALLFIVRSGGIVLNNYAETAFLKRFGVEFLPIVNMANAGVTVVVMGLMAGLMIRFPGPGLLGVLFLFCGVSIFALRLIIPLGIDLVYPVLFMLKALYEVLLAMLFWNLANDLFNTRQSKRLFPLITAGGVVGQILGSFATPWLARITAFDNLLVIYLGITAVGAGLVRAMVARYPTLMVSPPPAKGTTHRTSIVSEIRNIAPLMKESPLMWIMIALTFLPNVVIPIMNYQFNYAVDSQFASEASMIRFFGYFRGALNSVSLVILLFVGKIYGRWGLPVALMFHPFNYMLAFAAFLFRFDVFSAMYARLSTNVIRTTINIPANAVIMGLFPEAYRSMVRPFLRGTVVRLGLFLGSGLILASASVFHPRYLSLVALPFILAWAATPFVLKRRYASILLDLVSRDELDLKSHEPRDLAHVFSGRAVRDKLFETFHGSHGETAVWFGRLLKQIDTPRFGAQLLTRLPSADADTQVALLALMTEPEPASDILDVLAPLALSNHPAVAKAALEAMDRVAIPAAGDLIPDALMTTPDPTIRALVAAIRYRRHPDLLRPVIAQWIQGPDPDTRIAGVLAAGRVGDGQLAPQVLALLVPDQQPALLYRILAALPALGIDRRNPMVAPYLTHDDSRVRGAALRNYTIMDEPSLRRVIERLGDADESVADLAVETIAAADFEDGKALIKALDIPNTRLRSGVFTLIERLQIRTPDINRFVDAQITGAYRCLAERRGLAALPESPFRQLLADHLDQERHRIVETVIRILATQDTTGRLTVVRRGLAGSDPKKRANSIEALDDLLETRLARILVPLIDGRRADLALALGRQRYRLPEYGSDPLPLLEHLLTLDQGVTVLLAAATATELPPDRHPASLARHPRPEVAALIRGLTDHAHPPPSKETNRMQTSLTVPEIILRLKRIEIFEGLTVNQLAAIASVTEEETVPAGTAVIQEGDAGDTLYLVIDGETTVFKQQSNGTQVELDRIGPGDYFGEMALIDDIPRSATIRAVSPTRLLLLRKQEFNEMVREYPQIALEICRVLGARIRRLHEKIGRDPQPPAIPDIG